MYQLRLIYLLVSLPLIILSDEDKDDKLILSPIELIDLVIQDRKRDSKIPPITNSQFKDTYRFICKDSTVTANTYEDIDMLKRRKIWSRWGKWGQCSVSCGDGTISRNRHCVGGRCAPGELEEQRRSCQKPPCTLLPNTALEETHDLE